MAHVKIDRSAMTVSLMLLVPRYMIDAPYARWPPDAVERPAHAPGTPSRRPRRWGQLATDQRTLSVWIVTVRTQKWRKFGCFRWLTAILRIVQVRRSHVDVLPHTFDLTNHLTIFDCRKFQPRMPRKRQNPCQKDETNVARNRKQWSQEVRNNHKLC